MTEKEKNELAAALMEFSLHHLKTLKNIANGDRDFEKIREIVEVEGAIDTILNFLPKV